MPLIFAQPLISNAFDRIFAEMENKHLAAALLNAFLMENAGTPIGEIEDIDYLVSQGLFIQSGCTQDPIFYYGKNQVGRNQVIQVDVQHLYPGMEKCVVKATERMKYKLGRGEKMEKDTEVVSMAFCSFGFSKTERMVCHHLRDDKRNNDYHFIWIDLKGYDFIGNPPASETEQWAYFIQFAQECRKIPEFITSEMVRQAFEAARLKNWSALDKKWYNRYKSEFRERLDGITKGLMEHGVRLNPAYLAAPARFANLNSNLLKMNLGIYPVREVKPIEINIQAYKSHKKTAFSLFRRWAEKYKEQEGKELVIKDESPLVRNFEDALKEAVQLLYLEDDFVMNGLNPVNGTDFVIAVTEVRLSQDWYIEYVLKDRDAFKSVQALRAILAYFEDKESSEIEIEALYESQLYEISNMEGGSKQIKLDIPSVVDQLTEKSLVNNQRQVRKVLEHILGNFLKDISNQTKNVPIAIKKTESCFDISTLIAVIAENKRLFIEEP